MKSFLRERLLARRPVVLTKDQFVAGWNIEHNIWAPADCVGYVCDACQGAAVRSFQRCEYCDSTGFIDIKKVHTSYRTYPAMASFRTGVAIAEEQRFDKFLKTTAVEDLELVRELLLNPPLTPYRKPSEKVKPKLVRRIRKKTGEIARKPGVKQKKARANAGDTPSTIASAKPQAKKGATKPATKTSSRKKKVKGAGAPRASA